MQARWPPAKHEPISESAPAWADGSEERKPEGEGGHESQPDLKRLPDKETKKGTIRIVGERASIQRCSR